MLCTALRDASCVIAPAALQELGQAVIRAREAMLYYRGVLVDALVHWSRRTGHVTSGSGNRPWCCTLLAAWQKPTNQPGDEVALSSNYLWAN